MSNEATTVLIENSFELAENFKDPFYTLMVDWLVKDNDLENLHVFRKSMQDLINRKAKRTKFGHKVY